MSKRKEPSSHLEPADIDPRNGEPSKDDKCPKCGAEIYNGFGLAYGGYGPYSSCTACDWFHKESAEE